MKSHDMVSSRTPFLFLLACMVFPFGVAVQNLVMALCAGILVVQIAQGKKTESWVQMWTTFRLPLISAWLFIGWGIVARLCNEKMPTRFPMESFGYWLWALLPFLYRMRYGAVKSHQWSKIGRYLVVVCISWGLLVLSQYLWRWRVVGVSLALDDGRPKGLFSHPLTLAYAAGLLWPLSVQWCLRFPKKASGWLLLLAIGGILVLTRSRTVQAVSLLVLLWNLFFLLRGSFRIGALCLLLAGVGGVLSTNNLISHNIRAMWFGESVDRHSGYADDRLAFWRVHANMFMEHPIIGHGFGITEAYRMPYYEAIGLPHFIKPYPAHNLFLQVLVNEGLIGFSFFLVWIGWYLVACRKRIRSAFAQSVFLQTWVGFLLAGLTQNSFQDAGVRMCLTLFCVSIWACIEAKEDLTDGSYPNLGGQPLP